MKKRVSENKYLLLCSIANIMFFMLTYKETGRITKTFIHFCGVIPLIFQIQKAFKIIHFSE